MFEYKSVLVLFNEGHIWIVLPLLDLCIRKVDPWEETIQKETKWILVHI